MDVSRDVGPIEGREVFREDPASPRPDASSGASILPVLRTGAHAPAAAWREVRRNRGKDVADSRPLPEWVRRFSWMLDDAFEVPGLPGRRVGFDGLVALVPVAGDVVGVSLSLVIVVVGIAAGVSIPTILRMLLHIGFEALVGLVPFVGTVFNMAYKANNRNVALIERDLASRAATRRSSLAILVLTAAVAVVGLIMLILLSIAGIAVLVWFVSKLL